MYQLVWGRSHDEDETQWLCERFSVKLVCIGHAKVDQGATSLGQHLLMLNSDHANGAALVVDLSNVPDAFKAEQSCIQISSLIDREAAQ